MKTLKLTLLAILTIAFVDVNAQGIDGGTILMGGSLGFSSSGSEAITERSGSPQENSVTGSQFQFSLSPKMGYFFFRNFAAGMLIDFNTSSRTTEDSTGKEVETESQLLAGPFFRYYVFPAQRFGVFAELSVGFGAGQVNDGGQAGNIGGGQLNVGVGPGITFFANDIVAVEALAKYNYFQQTSSYTDNGINTTRTTTINKIDVGVGFQLYFNRVIGGGPGGTGVN